MRNLTLRLPHLVLFGLSVVALSSCTSAYYNTMEKMGIHKRDILADRVDDAKKAQENGQEKFSSALEQFQAFITVDEPELQQAYKKLSSEYERCQESAEDIHERIDGIEEVADDLFEEWEDELGEIQNRTLRQDSENKLKNTKRKYSQLIGQMRDSESKLDPALSAMQDQVLYLKHNLNARAIEALRQEATTVDQNIEALLQSMQAAIKEADIFLSEIE